MLSAVEDVGQELLSLFFGDTQGGIAQYLREPYDRIEWRPEFVRHVCQERRFVPVCDFQLITFFAPFLKQTDVLDRDHGLVGKRLEQSNLPFRERPHLKPAYLNDTNRRSITQQWNAQLRPSPNLGETVSDRRIRKFVERPLQVLDLDDLSIEDGSAGYGGSDDGRRLNSAR